MAALAAEDHGVEVFVPEFPVWIILPDQLLEIGQFFI